MIKSQQAMANTQNLHGKPKRENLQRERGEFYYHNDDYRWASL